MTYVVTDNCIKCKYTDCVEVCPVDCFYEGENFLVIHFNRCAPCENLAIPGDRGIRLPAHKQIVIRSAQKLLPWHAEQFLARFVQQHIPQTIGILDEDRVRDCLDYSRQQLHAEAA